MLRVDRHQPHTWRDATAHPADGVCPCTLEVDSSHAATDARGRSEQPTGSWVRTLSDLGRL